MISPMRRVNELVSSNIGDYLTNVKTWGNVMYNVLEHGLIGDGVTDDTAALQTLINTAIAAGRKAIFFPHTDTGGQYFVTALTNANQVVFLGDNASFVGGYQNYIFQLGTDDLFYASGIKRQAIINGSFAVNQRLKTGTVVLTAGQYGHDRWKAGSAGCTYTFATVNGVTTITITAGSLVQVIEGINLRSGNYTLSWIGTAQGKIGAGSFGGSGITGAVVGGTNLSIEFNAGTLFNVQFNFGDRALPFQPQSFAQELINCQRYYNRSGFYNSPFTATSTVFLFAPLANAIVGFYKFPANMRATPTISISQNNIANQFRNTASGALVNPTGISPFAATTNGIGGFTISGASFTVGQIYEFDVIAESEL